MSMRFASALLLAMMLLGTSALAQQQTPAPATLPAEALTLASEMEPHMPERLLEWTKKRARAALRKQFTESELSAAVVAKAFPGEPEATREAIRFMAGYQAYRRVSDLQETQAARLREIDRDIRDTEDRARMLEAIGAPIGSVAEVQLQNDRAVAQIRLENLQQRREMTVRAGEGDRKNGDACLRWLAEAHARVKDVAPEILSKVKGPR